MFGLGLGLGLRPENAGLGLGLGLETSGLGLGLGLVPPGLVNITEGLAYCSILKFWQSHYCIIQWNLHYS